MKSYLLHIISNEKKDILSRVIRFVLAALSFIYSIVLYFMILMYRLRILKAKKHNIKVISIGNITTGGTGKTPLTAIITEYLLKSKKKVAIISRGYKGVQGEQGFLADEPQMLKTMYPEAQVIINRDRNAALKLAQRKMNCDVAVIDDGFGNLAILKDLDIVCINCLNPFGYGHILPWGLLRMPLFYLANAQIFVLTHADQAPDKVADIINVIRKYNKEALIFKSAHVPEYLYNIINKSKRELKFLKGEKVALLCAIAEPKLFKKTVESLGANVVCDFNFQDHHLFSTDEINLIVKKSINQNIKTIITTAKDEPRIKAVLSSNDIGIEILVLKIKIEVEENERGFMECISALFAD